MKIKTLLLGSLIASCTCIFNFAHAQDIGINITPLQSSILNYETGAIDVTICNDDPDPITAPANRIRPLISFSENLTITEVVNTDGTPVSDFTILSLENIPGSHSVRLLYNPTLENATCISFHIRFTGNKVGNGIIVANLGFADPGQTPGNDTGNDNSTTTTPVEVNLPVTLKEFNASSEGKTASLTWATTEETNSDRFDVQRSFDGKEWKTIQTVAATGESKAQVDYAAVDNDPLEGDNFYRLHMIDKDGTSAYSRIRNVKFEGVATYTYPNPVSEELTIQAADWSKISKVKIVGSDGKEVYRSAGKPSSKVNVKGMPKGVYVVQLTNTNGSETTYKIVVN
ncbi:T9SS type A sorting domain-containing protein [Dyadobacter sp. CY327]|uniref:T9SS type A sorting domain-containing protein n=1 Tax=Dyadobacter sp. CY327 TaxID=2907301 RepID=UPI001F3B5B99|nr:T9SS type A sorting domain-containing protein [Dyadobacter sp. CY327]MCE7069078.1 T9SS type A sorting domain-containing protein [Dyadobacter sp. CY327]